MAMKDVDGIISLICGGTFEHDPDVAYKGGIMHDIYINDVDRFNVFDIKYNANWLIRGDSNKENRIKNLFYRIPGMTLGVGLKDLKTDSDFLAMIKYMLKSENKKIECYVEHIGDVDLDVMRARSLLDNDVDLFDFPFEIVEGTKTSVKFIDNDVADGEIWHMSKVTGLGMSLEGKSGCTAINTNHTGIESEGIDCYHDEACEVQNEESTDLSKGGEEDANLNGSSFVDVPVKETYNKHQRNEDEAPGECDDEESDDIDELEYAQMHVEGLSDDDEELVEARIEIKNFYTGGNKSKTDDKANKGKKKVDFEVDDGCETEYFDSDEDGSYDSSASDEDDAVRHKSYAPVYDVHSKNPKFCIGMKFSDAEEFKDALTKYSIANRVEIGYSRNSWNLLRAYCTAPNCPWKITGALSTKQVFRVARLSDEDHTCARVFKNRRATGKWLADNLFHNMSGIATMKYSDMQQMCKDQLRLDVSYGKMKRVRKLVIEKFAGNLNEEYARLCDYRLEILRSNPGSTVILNTHKPAFGKRLPIFDCIYIAYGCCKEGFIKCCRKMIGLDGAFLKGPVKGVVLSAIGRDANNQMYPIAWAVVEAETIATWTWFVRLLKKDLCMLQGEGWGVIADKHPGIWRAVKDELPKAEHRFCARHIFAKWRRTYRGDGYGKQFWKCAKATNIPDFEKFMLEIKLMSKEAHDELMKNPPDKWCKAFFNTELKCDIVDNNLCEAFNGRIVGARTKCIITMLEEIRLLVLNRIRKNMEICNKWKDGVGDRIRKRLLDGREASFDCEVIFNGSNGYEVVHWGSRHIVDLQKRTCSCRGWDVSGIPCCHAIKCILTRGDEMKTYIDPWFSQHIYKQLYSHVMQPLAGMKFWPKSGKDPIQHPAMKSNKGRPKVQRIKTNGESYPHTGKISKKGTIITCKRCYQMGHNQRTCKNEPTPPPPKPVRPPKRSKIAAPVQVKETSGPNKISPQQLLHKRDQMLEQGSRQNSVSTSTLEPRDGVCTQDITA